MRLAPTIMAELRDRYGERHRAYHTWAHIEDMMDMAESLAALIAQSETFHLAVLFHDAIYDPRAADNEAASAALMRTRLMGHIDESTLDHAEALILATSMHRPPETSDATLESDAGLFLDMDLAILGAPPERFRTYDEAIRREYAHVPDEEYRIGRAAVLNRFLKRERIYRTDLFHHSLESQARTNLAAAIAELESKH